MPRETLARFEIPLTPRGKESVRFNPITKMATKAPTTRRYEAVLAELIALVNAAMGVRVIEGPVSLEAVFLLQRPAKFDKRDKSGALAVPATYQFCTTKPDADNIIKSLQDAMKAQWRDDSQVCVLAATKLYVPYGHKPRMIVRLSVPDIQEQLQSLHESGMLLDQYDGCLACGEVKCQCKGRAPIAVKRKV